MTEAEQIMKRCQAGTRNYEEANNLHAACYGIIGKLLAQTEQWGASAVSHPAYVAEQKRKTEELRSMLTQPEQDSTCSITLRLQGKPYPRTCKKCGLGPCIAQPTAQPEQEPPKYSFKAYWEADGHIGIAGVVVRPDGGAHVLQQTIDPPQRTWVGLTDEEMEDTFIQCGGKWNGDFWKIEDADFHPFLRTIEAKLKEKTHE